MIVVGSFRLLVVEVFLGLGGGAVFEGVGYRRTDKIEFFEKGRLGREGRGFGCVGG